MDCKRVSRLIDAYAAGELAGERADEVKAHVEGCAACAKLCEQYRLTLLALRSEVIAAPEADARFFRKLDKRLGDADRRAGLRTQSVINWRSAFGVAAAAAALFIISVQFVPMTPLTTDRAAARPARMDYRAPAIALNEELMPDLAYRSHPSPYTSVSMGVSQESTGQDTHGRGLPRFVFPRQGLPIEGTPPLQTQSTITRVDYERLQTKVNDLELRLNALEHKAQ
jgi:hypothetical protein